MTTSTLPSLLAYFVETTPGTGPANSAAWVSNGVRMRHIAESLDATSLDEAVIPDERSFENVNDFDEHIKGIRSGGEQEFPFMTYLHGSVDLAHADGTQTPANALSNLMAHAYGGQTRTTTDVVATAGVTSTLVIEIETDDEFPVGSWLGVADSNGLVHHRRVTGLAAGGVGQVLTLHRALSFTPADGSLVRGCIVIHELENTSLDSDVAGRTYSWLIQRGKGAEIMSWETNGCKSYLTSIELSRNAAPKLGFSTKVGSFDTPNDAPDPAWVATPFGAAGRVIGIGTRVFVGDVGSATEARVNCSSFSIVPGVVPSPIPTLTEEQDGMPGIAAYTLERNMCRASVSIPSAATDFFDDFDAATLKHIQFERLAQPGSSWSIYFPNVQVDATPKPTPIGLALGQQLEFHALRGAGSTDIETSRMQIIMC